MKKLLFVLITLFCFFLIGCNEKKNNMSADSKENLENVNHEQEKGNDVDSQSDEQNDNNEMMSQNREHVLSIELELKLKEIVCKKNNEKISNNCKELKPEDLQVIKYFGGFWKNNSVHVLLMKDIIIDNKVTAVYTPFYSVTINESSISKSYMLKKLPELIFVINLNDNNIYTLFDACEKNMLTINDMNEIYRQYQMMVEDIESCG